jgi:hypothetical protein
MFRHRQSLRRWAVRVLFLWLFGLVAATAHACLVTPPAAPVAAKAVEGRLAQSHDLEAARHTPNDATGLAADDPQAAHPNCVDFCDKASISITPLKSALDAVQAYGLALPMATTPLRVAAFAPAPWHAPRQADRWAPPIRVVLVRLAL